MLLALRAVPLIVRFIAVVSFIPAVRYILPFCLSLQSGISCCLRLKFRLNLPI